MNFSESDLHYVGEVLARAAREEIMPRFQNLTAAQIHRKTSAFDLVTEADEAAEALIATALKAKHPGAIILGEEGTQRDPGVLKTFGSAGLAFIVDPIDGTRNFVAGLPLFGVMAAVTIRGEIVASVIHDPISCDWAYALRNAGAWLERADSTRIPYHVASPTPLCMMEGVVAPHFLPEPQRTHAYASISKIGSWTLLRCAAHDYRLAAAGHLHFMLYSRIMPWDHAAGWLLHHEAGGYSAHFDGSPYLPTHADGGLLCAPDESSWHAIRAEFLPESVNPIPGRETG